MKRLVIFAGAFISINTAAAQQHVAQLPVTKNKFVVIAHRGNHVNVPENTVAAIEATIQAGADYAELDLRTSADGKLVLMHDATVERTTNGKGKVSDLTLEEIKKLVIRGKDGKTYQVPTFEEALKAARGKLNIYLDFKDADVMLTVQQLKAAGMEKQVVVYLNKETQYTPWQQTAPAIPLMSSVPDEVKTPEQLQMLLDKIHLSILDNVTDTAMIAMAHKLHVAIWLDAQTPTEGPAEWEAALRKGVQGIQSDHPEALVNYLDKNHLRNGIISR